MLVYIGLGEYLEAERFCVLPVKGRDFCINTKGLIRLTVNGAFNHGECCRRTLQRLELMTAMDGA